MNSASTRHPQLEVPHDVAQESDFWKFVGAVAIPTAGVALFALVISLAPRIALHFDSVFSVQPSAGGSPEVDISREQLQAVWQGSRGEDPTITEAPTEQSPVAPYPVVPPFAVPAERPPPLAVERDEPPGQIEPSPLPADLALAAPPDPDVSEPEAGSSEPPRELAEVPSTAPPTPEPRAPEPSPPEPRAPEPSPPEPSPPEPPVAARPTEPPASPEPPQPTPVETQPSPAQPVSPEPEPPAEVAREPSAPAPPVAAPPTEPPASPEPTQPAPGEIQPGPVQPVSPRPRPSVPADRAPPPAEAAPEPPPVGLPATPTPGSGSLGTEPPQVAAIRPEPAAPLGQFLPPGRGSGHKLLARLAATASTEGCDSRELPFFRVVESNVLPAQLPPGGRFSHRLVYALCPAGQGAPATATVTRELRGGAEVVLIEEADGFQLRPGTWASDEELVVPPTIDPGRYTVNTTVTFGDRVWTEQTDLLIE